MSLVGIGVDLEAVSRFANLKEKKRFLERVFSPAEIEYCKKFRNSAPHFAARFCAKEALVKAARSIVPIQITDVETRNFKDGAPLIGARTAKSHIRKFFTEHQVMVSLSHTDTYATAYVVVMKKGKRK